MNIRASYRYQMVDHKKSIITFYIIMLLIFTFLFTTIGITVHNADGSISKGTFSGIDISSAIFLFVAALASYKETFGMLIQNGVSRRTMFIGRILTTVSLALVMATIDNMALIMSKMLAPNMNLVYISLYEKIYSERVMEVSNFQIHVESFFFDFFMYLAFMAVGHLITTIFYRLNKTGRVLLATGLPVGIFAVLPMIDSFVTKGKIMETLMNFFDIALGLSKQMPLNAMISGALVLILLSVLSWLFIRKANVRE